MWSLCKSSPNLGGLCTPDLHPLQCSLGLERWRPSGPENGLLLATDTFLPVVSRDNPIFHLHIQS